MMRLLAPITILHPLLLTGLCWVSATTTLLAESANQESASVHLSRYRLQYPQPTIAQRDPLQRVIKSLHFNHQASVGSAITTLLKDSGYNLTSFHPDARVYQLLALPLPKVHHSLGPITLTQALSTLAGSPWRLVVDPIHRLISFQLPDYFQTAKTAKTKGTR
jgi:type IV pili sensor histidine kinase/response regulator